MELKKQCKFTELGKMSQLMPSIIRMACRSNITYIEDEMVDIMKADAIRQLENFSSGNHYRFIDKHLYILHRVNCPEVRDFVRNKKHLYRALMPFCKFENEGHNITCCSCSRVKEIVDYYLNSGE